MITYEYCQLSLGQSLSLNYSYFDRSKGFVIDKNKVDDVKVHVTTDSDYDNSIPNLVYHKFQNEYPMFNSNYDGTVLTRTCFNYNLKFLSIKNALKELNSDYLIMTDGDF